MRTMKAAVMQEPGGPEVLKIEIRPIPKPQNGEVLIRVKAFGLNRSELFTRQGHTPGVRFPRVLGIEAAGVVEEAPPGEFHKRRQSPEGDGRSGPANRTAWALCSSRFISKKASHC